MTPYERSVVIIVAGGAVAGIVLLFALFSGPDRADRPATAASPPAQTTGSGTSPGR
jgi:hypothetical protein